MCRLSKSTFFHVPLNFELEKMNIPFHILGLKLRTTIITSFLGSESTTSLM